MSDKYFWTPWSTIFWGRKQGSGAAASVSQLRAALTQCKTCECDIHLSLPPPFVVSFNPSLSLVADVWVFVFFNLLIEPKVQTQLGPCTLQKQSSSSLICLDFICLWQWWGLLSLALGKLLVGCDYHCCHEEELLSLFQGLNIRSD